MTARQAIDNVNAIKPNAFTDAVKLRWLNEIEGRIATEILRLSPAELENVEVELTDELIIELPYDSVYVRWLEARIDEALNEYDKYANTMQMFNVAWQELLHWFAVTYDPAQGYFTEEWRRRHGLL